MLWPAPRDIEPETVSNASIQLQLRTGCRTSLDEGLRPRGNRNANVSSWKERELLEEEKAVGERKESEPRKRQPNCSVNRGSGQGHIAVLLGIGTRRCP